MEEVRVKLYNIYFEKDIKLLLLKIKLVSYENFTLDTK